MINFFALVLACAPNVAPETLSAIVEIESSYNPYAIGVVGGYLERQPKTKEEALATAKMLLKNNYNFSLGLAQVNRYNLPRYHITIEEAFDPCINLKIGAKILEECFVRASKKSHEQDALRQAFSCYYSGNFIRGFKPDAPNSLSYVDKVVNAAMRKKPSVPKIKVSDSSSLPAKTLAVINASAKTAAKNNATAKTKMRPLPAKPPQRAIRKNNLQRYEANSPTILPSKSTNQAPTPHVKGNILTNPLFSSDENGTLVF